MGDWYSGIPVRPLSTFGSLSAWRGWERRGRLCGDAGKGGLVGDGFVVACGLLFSACSSPHASVTTSTLRVDGRTTTVPTTSTMTSVPSALSAGTSVSGSDVGPLSFIDDDQGFGIYKSLTNNNAYLAETDDGGVRWRLTTGSPISTYLYPSKLDFIDAQTGYAWGGGTLWVTHDGGAQWLDSYDVASGGEVVSPIGNNVWALTSSGIEASSNAGATWMPLVTPPLSSSFILSRVSTTVAYVVGCLRSPNCDSEGLARIHRKIESDRGRASAKRAFLQGKMVVTTTTTPPTGRHCFDARILSQSRPSRRDLRRRASGGQRWVDAAGDVGPAPRTARALRRTRRSR